MPTPKTYSFVFGNIPIFGMLHLSGQNPMQRALEEVEIFEEEGVNGAIVENYHGSLRNVICVLRKLKEIKPQIAIGVNILPNEFDSSLSLAREFNADFIQLDHVAGKYASGTIDVEKYRSFRQEYSEIFVFGGVWPKYYCPIPGSALEADLKEGKQRADAIVVTGEGTGKETPIEKIRTFRKNLGSHPLIIGAGITPNNAYEQLLLSNGAIVGSCLKKNNDTKNIVDRFLVRDLMSVVREVREIQRNS